MIALPLDSGMKGPCLGFVIRWLYIYSVKNTWPPLSLRVWHREICNPKHTLSWPTSFKSQGHIYCSMSLKRTTSASKCFECLWITPLSISEMSTFIVWGGTDWQKCLNMRKDKLNYFKIPLVEIPYQVTWM